MKNNVTKCDLCLKNNKFKSESLNSDKPEHESDVSNDASHNNSSNINSSVIESDRNELVQQSVLAKCLDCNYFLCSSCILEHQMINSFNNHQLVNLNSITINGKDDQTEQDDESSAFVELQKKHQLNANQLNTSMSSLSSSSSAKMN